MCVGRQAAGSRALYTPQSNRCLFLRAQRQAFLSMKMHAAYRNAGKSSRLSAGELYLYFSLGGHSVAKCWTIMPALHHLHHLLVERASSVKNQWAIDLTIGSNDEVHCHD